MIYRMLAMDIDGTLLNHNGRLNKESKEAIEYAQSKGIHVTLVTNRNFSTSKRLAKALKIEGYIVTHSGAYIASKLEKPLYVNKINEDITYEVVNFLEKFNVQIAIVHEKFTVMNKQEAESSMLGKISWQRDSKLFYGKQYVESISEHLLEKPVAAPKIEAAFSSNEEAKEIELALNGMYDEIECIHRGEGKMDIVAKGVSKLRGLLYLCERLGITREQVVMVGSKLDDISLMECCGLGVAMGNAPKEVKEAADWITRTEAQNGVQYMVKELFRKQHPIDFLKKMNVIK
ncbi:Cof-type HAD-IIB family hydrolase [Rossellomorea sp. BNER]|jgi:Cof subfamily protein (haloacid dehalogenase superfamily)|uniref:Cof-type HAD-IIB family hydrolase n=1 Tax=Rossellomorea sp. BNER TaxID=2962031 RepID=UPI003AF1F009|nr:Cof-type HAD-IIB family hydrolase [Rossellomorea sp. BNER]